METYATTLSKYSTAEAALEKNQPQFSQVPYTDAQATMINREVERTELAQSSAIHAAEHSTGLLGGGWGWNLAPGVAHARVMELGGTLRGAARPRRMAFELLYEDDDHTMSAAP